MRNIAKILAVTCLAVSGLVVNGCSSGGAEVHDNEIAAKIPQLKSLLASFKRAVPRPTTPVYVPLSNIMQRYFSSVLALPDTDIKEQATLAARDMNRLLDFVRERQTP